MYATGDDRNSANDYVESGTYNDTQVQNSKQKRLSHHDYEAVDDDLKSHRSSVTCNDYESVDDLEQRKERRQTQPRVADEDCGLIIEDNELYN